MVDARRYHAETNHTPEKLRSQNRTLDQANRPRPFKEYLELPSEPLPEIDPPEVPALEAVATASNDGLTSSIDLDSTTIATLCYLAAGLTQEMEHQGREIRFRAASCTGNLHHIDLYFVCGDLRDLDAGVYHFDPEAFAFDILRTGDYRGTVAKASGEGDIATAPLTVFATSTWWRNAWKYIERTYRHAFWDTGTVLANLLAASHALGLPTSVVSSFAADPLLELLSVNPNTEAPIAGVAIGDGHPVPAPPKIDPIDSETAPLSSNPRAFPLIIDAWQQSTLPDGESAERWRQRCQEARSIGQLRPGTGERIELEPVGTDTATARPLLATVERRGSKREFAAEGPSRRQLGTILDRATRGIPADWNRGIGNELEFLNCYVLATGVQEVPDGTYQYLPEVDELERLGDVTSADQTHLALNQDWAGEAHVNIYCMADIEAIVETLGNRGYRLAQLEAGITLGRLYLATAAHRRLGGTGLTFFDELVTDFLSPRASSQMPMTLFAFGTVTA